MPDFVGGCAALGEGRLRGSTGSERTIVDHHAVGGNGTARKLCVSQQSAAERTHPHVHVRPWLEWRDSPSGAFLHTVVVREGRLDGLGARDLDDLELDARVGDEPQPGRRSLVAIGVGRPKILIHRLDLTRDLCRGDILRCGVVDDVDNGLDGDDLHLREIVGRLAPFVGGALETHLRGPKRGELFEQHHVSGHRAARATQFTNRLCCPFLGHVSS